MMFSVPYNDKAAEWYCKKQSPICKDIIKDELKKTTNADEINFLNDVQSSLEILLKGKPKALLDIQNYFSEKYGMNSDDPYGGSEYFCDVTNKIFNYAKLSGNKEFAYELAKKIGVTICPYCNREFINTIVIEESEESRSKCEISRPEFDHFFPKSKYPLLALSYYNLIPSGHICNSSIKHDRELDINTHIHPYIKDSNDVFNFRSELTGMKDGYSQYKIDIATESEKVRNTFDFFYLRDIYQSHIDIVERIYEIYNKYPDGEFRRLVEYFKKFDMPIVETEEDLLNILYSEFIIKDADKEILGKLKQDMYLEILQLYDLD